MARLPEGWAEVTLGEIVEVNPRRKIVSLEKSVVSFVPMAALNERSGKVVAAEVRAYSDVRKGYTQFQEGDVLFAKITPSMENGKSAVARDLQNGVGFGSTEFHVLRSYGAILPEFLWRFMRQQSFRDLAKHTMTGAVGQQRVPAGFLSDHQIRLPPLDEQQRIVANIDKLLARVVRARDELECVSKLVERAKARALHAVFRDCDNWTALGEILDGIKGGKNLRCAERPPEPHETGVVKVSAVTWGEFDPNESKTFPPGYVPSDDILIRPGDLLFSRANTVELVGAVVIVDGAPGNLYLSDKVLRLDIADGWKEWVFWYLRSPIGREALMEASSGNQMSMRNISQSLLKRIPIPSYPPGLRGRKIRAIRAVMEKLSFVLAEAGYAIARLDNLEQQILAKAFRGELVPQDRDDEPASALLERVRAMPDNQKAAQNVERLAPVAHAPERSPRKPRTTAMPKARTDDDVWHQPYLAELLRLEVLIDEIDLSVEFGTEDIGPRTPETVAQALFKKSDMEIADFYKQLAWEIETGHIVELGGRLRAA